MEESRWLSAIAGGPVLLKAENLQRAGSFKIRGAYTRMHGLSAQERAHGVVAASAGNHAQGVALAAQLLGIHAVVYMPVGAPIPKEKATRGYGAEVRFHGTTVDEALVAARAYADETGAVLVHPFDHPDIVAGQATCGLEILEQCPDVRTVLVPTGGGGLLAGIAAAVKADPTRRPGRRRAGRGRGGVPALAGGWVVREALVAMATMADGIAVGRPGDVPFAHGPGPRRRDPHRQRGVAVPGAADAHRARQARRRAGRGRRGRRAAGPPAARSRRPRWWCSRAATSTRSC